MGDTLGDARREREREEAQELWEPALALEAAAAMEPDAKPLLGPLRTSQVGFLAAPPGVGKSMLALAIAAAISMNRSLGDWLPQPREEGLVTAKIVDAEMTASDLLERVRILGCEAAPMWFDHMARRGQMNYPPFALPADIEYLMMTCGNSEVLIIDNLTFTLDAAPGHSLYAPESIDQLRLLFNWARAEGKLLIIIDHTNAQGKLAGNLNKQRLADWVAILEPNERVGNQELNFDLNWQKWRGKDRPTHGTQFTMTQTGDWTTRPVLALPEQIRELTQEGLDIKEIAKELDCSVQYVRRCKR